MRQFPSHSRSLILAIQSLRRAVAVSVALLAPVSAQADNITVFAASSLKTALDAVADGWSAQTGHQVAISYDGSSKLAKQIQLGAPADIFISAAPEWMDLLQTDGLIVAETRRDIVSNRIVLIAHDPSTPPVTISADLDLRALLKGGKLSMAMVDTVPAGQYGKEALDHFGLWEQVEPDVVQSDNVRAALALVALGEAPLGIVYTSDAVADPDGGRSVTIIATFPPDSHRTILYPAAQTTASSAPAATAFLDHLSSDAARTVFAANGFTLLSADD